MMNKVPAAALIFFIFISSASAEPIKMTDGELEMIHGGNLLSFEINSMYPDGSAVVIQNGIQYLIAPGATLSLPDGTQVQIMQNSNGSTLVVTNSVVNISANMSVDGGSANGHLLLKNY